jgi:hypothetical protein
VFVPTYKVTLLVVVITFSFIIFILLVFHPVSANSKDKFYQECDNRLRVLDQLDENTVYTYKKFFSIQKLSYNIIVASIIDHYDILSVQHKKIRVDTYIKILDILLKENADILIKQDTFYPIHLGKRESDKNITIFTNSEDQSDNKFIRVLVEFRVSGLNNLSSAEYISKFVSLGLMLDSTFNCIPIPMERGSDVQAIVIRGSINETKIKQLESLPFVIRVIEVTEDTLGPFE